MSNASRIFNYRIFNSGGAGTFGIFVRADINANTLILNGVTNADPGATTAGTTFRIILPGRGGPRAKTAHARTVTIVMTAAGADLSVGSRVTIPVFAIANWSTYRVGQVGTFNGFACRCVFKQDGSPSNSGREF